jgi:hypothetical protein
VTHAGEFDPAALWADPVFDFEMAGLHTHLDSKASERKNAGSVNIEFAGCVLLR